MSNLNLSFKRTKDKEWNNTDCLYDWNFDFIGKDLSSMPMVTYCTLNFINPFHESMDNFYPYLTNNDSIDFNIKKSEGLNNQSIFFKGSLLTTGILYNGNQPEAEYKVEVKSEH